MNPLNALTTPNETTILLLGGVALLLINVMYGFVRTARGHLKAGWFTVGLVLIACTLIGVGSVQSALASAALGASRAGFNGARPAATASASDSSADSPTPAPDATAARSRSGSGGARLTATAAAAAGGASADSATPAPDATAARSRSGFGGARLTATAAAAAGGASADSPTPAPTATDPAANSATPVPGVAMNTTTGLVFPPTNTPRAPAPSDSEVLVSNTRRTTLLDGTPGMETTPTPAGTPGRRRGTPSAAAANAQQPGPNGDQPSSGSGGFSGGQGNGASTNTNNGGNAGGNTANSFASGLTTLQLDQSGLFLATLGGGLALLFALALYYVERRRPNFLATHSRGLLNAGAGLFAVIAVLIIPIIPGEFSGSVSAAGLTPRAAPVVRRTVASATPSATPTATLTPTLLPTLTPTLTDTPITLPTPISYAAAQPTATPTPVGACTVVATANLNLRGDPSTNHPPIGSGSIPSGTMLSVTGQSRDMQWWQVTYNDGTGSLTGWVSARYTTANSKCSLPLVQPTAKP